MSESLTGPPGSMLDAEARDALAVKHLDLVPKVVYGLPVSPPPGLDRDDLLSVGTLGLLNAARNYEPMRGASFTTFAFLSIRTAVLDELRRYDPLPRGARSRVKELRQLESEFQAEQGRLPTPTEIGEELELSRDETDTLLAQAEEVRLLYKDTATGSSPGVTGGPPSANELVDPTAAKPDADAAQNELIELVEEAVRELPDREREVFVLYHSENLYLKEIGELLGVSESRICQILACAQRKIRCRIEKGRTTDHGER